MLEDVKTALRIRNNAYDGEVTDLIAAAREDLKLSGVSSLIVVDDTNPLIKRAIVTYCKAYFGYENKDADRFIDSYVMLKQHLSLSGDFIAVE